MCSRLSITTLLISSIRMGCSITGGEGHRHAHQGHIPTNYHGLRPGTINFPRCLGGRTSTFVSDRSLKTIASIDVRTPWAATIVTWNTRTAMLLRWARRWSKEWVLLDMYPKKQDLNPRRVHLAEESLATWSSAKGRPNQGSMLRMKKSGVASKIRRRSRGMIGSIITAHTGHLKRQHGVAWIAPKVIRRTTGARENNDALARNHGCFCRLVVIPCLAKLRPRDAASLRC